VALWCEDRRKPKFDYKEVWENVNWRHEPRNPVGARLRPWLHSTKDRYTRRMYGPCSRAVFTNRVHGRVYGPCLRLCSRAVCMGCVHERCSQAVFTVRVHGPYVRAVFTACVHGPCLRSVFTGRVYGPCLQLVFTARVHGPYARAVFTGAGSYYPLTRAVFTSRVYE